ncbi:MAG: Amino acid/amide transporter rane protein 2, family [Sphingomonas bacterium]|nr:Amino acid/amide transporter rane protein 2, family [Sphingomonas bacterium]
MKHLSARARTISGFAVVIAVAAAIPLVTESYVTFQAATVLSYTPALLGLVVITGLTGQIALGHGAFFALGAYTTGILVRSFDWPYLATLPVAALLSLAFGALLGLPSLRLRGHFLAVLTLSVAIAAPQIFKHFDSWTNGARGLAVIIDDSAPWLHLDATQRNYFVALAVTILCFIATRAVVRGPVGRTLRATRDNEIVASVLGADVARLKIGALAFSTMLAGLGGSVFAIVIGFVAPENFSIGFAALLIIGLVLGGKESVWGAVIGSLLVVAIPLYAGKIDQTASGVVFAVVVIAATFVAPAGLTGLFKSLSRMRAAKPVSPTQAVLRPAQPNAGD